MLESTCLMQQHNSNALIQKEGQILNMSKKKVVTRYRSISPHYYQEGQENEEFEQKAHNFEPLIHYVVEQEVATQGIRMSKGVEPILITR